MDWRARTALHATYHDAIRKNLNPFVLFGGIRLPDADPWPERRRDHLGDRPSTTMPSRPHVTPKPAPQRVRI